MRSTQPVAGKWGNHFLLMNYTTPLPNVTRATEMRRHTAEYYDMPDAVWDLLDPLQLKELEYRVADPTARYALLAHHALVLHAHGKHDRERDVYGYLGTMETADWPMKRDAMLNEIRCLRERHLSETAQERMIDLCRQVVKSVEITMRILKDDYSEGDWTRSTLVRDERDFLLLASIEAKLVLGLPHSDEEDGLLRRAERRLRRRKHRSPYPYGKFWHDHREGLVRFWEQYRPVWLKDRYRQHYGREPLNEPIVKNLSGGWSVHPDYTEVYNARAFLRDAENSYRESLGLPLRGQGWSSEAHLKILVKRVAAPLTVLFEHSPSWLYPQRFDIFVPDLSLAIEYMGEQHYWEIDHFGGREAFGDRKRMDIQKRTLARDNGVTVLDWRYDEDINEAAVRCKLSTYL